MALKRKLTAETKYRLLQQISHDIRDTLDVDETLNHLLAVLRSVLAYDAAGIFVLNQGQVYPRGHHAGSVIAGIATRGFDPHPVETDAMLMEGKGIVGHVIRTGACVLAPDVSRDPHYVVGRQRTRSEVAVPIVRGDRVVGALDLESDRVGAFAEEDLEALRFFAEAAAISIAKAMLHQQLLEKQRLEEQLRIAQTVQNRLLPGEPPAVPGYEVAGLCLPTFEIGGDYFDWIDLPRGSLGLVVADVAGKGVAAALIMAVFRALLRVHARDGVPLAAMMPDLNRHLRESTGHTSFVTAFYGVLEPGTGRFEYVNCGHSFPLLLRADGSLATLETGGLFLGAFAETSYETGVVTLAPGELLVLCTDGVLDAENERGEGFEARRLAESVRAVATRPVGQIVQDVLTVSRAFRGHDQFEDDFTLLILKRLPATDRPG